MSLWYDDFEFQKLKPVMMEEISRYFLLGFLSITSLLRLLSSWTLGLGSGGLEAETFGMVLLSPIPRGAVGTPLLSSSTNPWSFLTTNFGELLIHLALLVLWVWPLSLQVLFTVLVTLELWTFCTFALGTFSTTDWDIFPHSVETLWTLGDLFRANNTYFTFSTLGALATVLVGIPAFWRCILLFFSPRCFHNVGSGSLSLWLDHTFLLFLC